MLKDIKYFRKILIILCFFIFLFANAQKKIFNLNKFIDSFIEREKIKWDLNDIILTIEISKEYTIVKLTTGFKSDCYDERFGDKNTFYKYFFIKNKYRIYLNAKKNHITKKITKNFKLQKVINISKCNYNNEENIFGNPPSNVIFLNNDLTLYEIVPKKLKFLNIDSITLKKENIELKNKYFD